MYTIKSRSFGLLGALLLASPFLLGGCADFPAGTGGTGALRRAPTAAVSQVVPGVDVNSTRLQVVKRGFGEGYAMFELNRAIDPARIDLAKTRLMTVRPGPDGKLQVIEAAGDVFLDDSGRILSIELAEQPQTGDIYRAVGVIDGETIELGDVIVRPQAEGGDTSHALYVDKTLAGRDIGPIKIFPLPTPTLTLVSSTPNDGDVEVARDIGRITLKYGGTELDCSNPITGINAFHLYSVDPALVDAQQQNMYPDMPAFYGPVPKLTCDAARHQISMELPGLLLGGSVFKVQTSAKSVDGTVLNVVTTFRTKNPGLQVELVKATNEIYQCETKIPFSDSFKCDIYLVSQAKTRVSANEAWQNNVKVPTNGDFSNWSEDTSKYFGYPNQYMLYQDALAIGDPMAVEIQAFDSDTGDAYKKALAFIGGLGKVGSLFWPPAGPIGDAVIAASQILPADGDDFEGGGTLFLAKSNRWGTVNPLHTFKLPGRPVDSQIALDLMVTEYPASWYAPAPIQ